ncbi:MAG: hypothetical protein QOH87_1350 [Trebonia sp.]|jgi:hypothetical protein|nr:hypothetical protein [Trebonia sp.]
MDGVGTSSSEDLDPHPGTDTPTATPSNAKIRYSSSALPAALSGFAGLASPGWPTT